MFAGNPNQIGNRNRKVASADNRACAGLENARAETGGESLKAKTIAWAAKRPSKCSAVMASRANR